MTKSYYSYIFCGYISILKVDGQKCENIWYFKYEILDKTINHTILTFFNVTYLMLLTFFNVIYLML
jgi:hypothetical protein